MQNQHVLVIISSHIIRDKGQPHQAVRHGRQRPAAPVPILVRIIQLIPTYPKLQLNRNLKERLFYEPSKYISLSPLWLIL